MTSSAVDMRGRERPSLVVATAIALALPLIGATMRAVGSQPGELADAPLAPLALAAVVGGPGVLALAARRRPALYLPAGLLCLPLAVLSVVTLPLLPTGVVLLTGTRLRHGIRGATGALALVVVTSAMAAGLFAAAFSHEDPRCWTTGDTTATVSRSGDGITMSGSGVGSGSGSCTSDVITVPEAVATIGVLGLFCVALVAVATRVGPRPV